VCPGCGDSRSSRRSAFLPEMEVVPRENVAISTEIGPLLIAASSTPWKVGMHSIQARSGRRTGWPVPP